MGVKVHHIACYCMYCMILQGKVQYCMVNSCIDSIVLIICDCL